MGQRERRPLNTREQHFFSAVGGLPVVVQQAASRFLRLRLMRTDRRGKGLAVRSGVLGASGEIVIFADADLSWSVEDLSRFMALVDAQTPIVIGSREGYGARRVGGPGYRHIMGRVFNRVVQAMAVPGVEEVQITARLHYPITPLPEGDSYLGFIFARADQPAVVEAALREAHRQLRFEIVPEIPLMSG